MTCEYFMRTFIDVSNKIISLGIDKGYFDSSDWTQKRIVILQNKRVCWKC